MCGVLKRATLQAPDLGFAVLPEFIGKGFGMEAAAATVGFAKEKLKLQSLCAITVPYNQASIKVLEKVGLKFKKRISLPNNPEELLLYQVTLQV